MFREFSFILLSALVLGNVQPACGQKLQGQARIDSLMEALPVAADDLIKADILANLCYELSSMKPDSGLWYGNKAMELVKSNKDLVANQKEWITLEARITRHIGWNYYMKGNYDSSLVCFHKFIDLGKLVDMNLGVVYSNMGNTYREMQEYSKALEYLFMALTLHHESGETERIALTEYSIGKVYSAIGDHKQSMEYFNLAEFKAKNADDLELLGLIFASKGWLYAHFEEYDSALSHNFSAKRIADNLGNIKLAAYSTSNLANVNFLLYNDSLSLAYNQEAGKLRRQMGDKNNIVYHLNMMQLLREVYMENNPANPVQKMYADRNALLHTCLAHADTLLQVSISIDNLEGHKEALVTKSDLLEHAGDYYGALRNHKAHVKLEDSLRTLKSDKKLVQLALQHEFDKKEGIARAEREKQAIQERSFRNTIAGGFGLSLIFLLLVFRQRNKLKISNEELDKTNQQLDKTNQDLVSTQSQLIHAEKMASLGELTAGIAHEIQNPLNFVNNFSEVSVELLDEVREELKAVKTRFTASPGFTPSPGLTASPGYTASHMDEDVLSDTEATLDDIKQNLEKITHHGKRADAIVKGMLAHSRAGKGEKEPTDINALAEEYLKLSYHGLRAKDNTFNADYDTDFDPDLPRINVVPQDIGRVLLNLINNAFQAVETEHAPSLQRALITVSTKLHGDRIEISVSDNGPGIPDAIKDKIFQPFFTTKPTGQGTGLGLSLSYDIVKAHGGEITISSQEGEYTKCTVRLPMLS